MESPDNEPLQELKHDPVPGYPRVFWIAFLIMGLYLLLILVSSPGPAAKGHGGDGGREKGSEGGKEEHGHVAPPGTTVLAMSAPHFEPAHPGCLKNAPLRSTPRHEA